MRQTEHFGLSLIETADMLSLKPLNENTEKIDAALAAQAEAIAGKLMMATGSYTGTGTRSVTIQTPGFTPKALIVRKARASNWINQQDQSLWLGADVRITYKLVASSNEPPSGYQPDEQFETMIPADIAFVAEHGQLAWSIPDVPQAYYDVTTDEGPAAINNAKGAAYEWIAFGVAE